jgi:hypothetical protein
MINLNNFTEQVKELIFYLDEDGGRKLLQQITDDDKLLIQGDNEAGTAFIELQFLIIPFLSTHKIAKLLGEHLSVGLRISDIDLSERIKRKLVFLYISDRDNCKKELKGAIINSKEIITQVVEVGKEKKLNTVVSWIKDYLANVRGKKQYTLALAQYYQRLYFLKLSEGERNVVKKLFLLYRFLSASSFTPEGYEDDLLMKTEDGRLVTTNKGQVVVLYDPKKTGSEQITRPKARTVSGPPKMEEEGGLEELREMANQYPAGSLERKVIDEEIKKLESGK